MTTTSITRVAVPEASRPVDSNIRRRYAVEQACWIWHPDVAGDEAAVLRFVNRFTLTEPQVLRLHVSADQRYELMLDGEFCSMGPDRSDPAHWSFASYELALAAGEHTLEALVWWIGAIAPDAQMSVRGGFICAVEGHAAQLNTGQGPWTVERVLGWSFARHHLRDYQVIGPAQIIDGAQLFANRQPAVAPAVIVPPIEEGQMGGVQGIWHLHPSPLPDMLRRAIAPGCIRAVADAADTTAPFTADDCAHGEIAAWQCLLTDENAFIDIPPQTTRRVLWDFDDYYCGYETITLSGGAGSCVSLEWAESLFHADEYGRVILKAKGQRDAVAGKVFLGFGEDVRPDGQPQRSYRSHWWRAGRYLLLTITTAAAPLRVERLQVIETRYPMENQGNWRCADAALDALTPIYTRAIQMCSHETYMDCPYYEQMMYVGDTRLQMLVTGVMTDDDRLIRRGIELFDWSRCSTGFVAERYPSGTPQQSLTFAMLWVAMLHDYAWWHNDPAFIRARMVGMRAQFEEFFALLSPESLLSDLPGWSFVDWATAWDNTIGIPPDGEFGASAIINLLFVQSLQQAAALEDAYGETMFSERYRQAAARVGECIRERFWSAERQLLADDLAQSYFSEHAQSLALLTDILPPAERLAVLDALEHDPTLIRTTIYFSHYLFEALQKYDRGDLIIHKLDGWKALAQNGLRTTVESPEPVRSDCHAWGAHPLFHYHASLAGIRPSAPGYAAVRIAPSPGPLTELHSSVPTPHGMITASCAFQQATRACHAEITLPPGLPGIFVWQGTSYPLTPGSTTVIEAP